MHLLSSALLAPSLLAAAGSARFVMYADEWHPTRPTNAQDRAGVDHVIIAFAMANNTAGFQPKLPITTIRQEFPDAKIMIAVGGWGDTVGFTEATKTDAGIQKLADDIATMIETNAVDGVDIDWEYPGGNGADYKKVPNSEKTHEIPAYPILLEKIRQSIGNEKLLSIAVPAKSVDMIAYTEANGPKIWAPVDYINIMAYDIMNRRDNVTGHHTSVQGATEAVENYLAIGAPAEKINLGFAYYAKYFTTQGDCGQEALGCEIVVAEDPVTGDDTLTSGAWTFEKYHMLPVDASALTASMDGTCGADKGTKCASSCCSQYGNCGTSEAHCKGACQHAFGTGCQDSDVAGSWQNALQNGVTDEEAGGQYYFDADQNLFWTWDTPELITRKFNEIVKKYELGGVMAWSLGEDSFDWSHIRQMGSELAQLGEATQEPESADDAPAKVGRPNIDTLVQSLNISLEDELPSGPVRPIQSNFRDPRPGFGPSQLLSIPSRIAKIEQLQDPSDSFSEPPIFSIPSDSPDSSSISSIVDPVAASSSPAEILDPSDFPLANPPLPSETESADPFEQTDAPSLNLSEEPFNPFNIPSSLEAPISSSTDSFNPFSQPSDSSEASFADSAPLFPPPGAPLFSSSSESSAELSAPSFNPFDIFNAPSSLETSFLAFTSSSFDIFDVSSAPFPLETAAPSSEPTLDVQPDIPMEILTQLPAEIVAKLPAALQAKLRGAATEPLVSSTSVQFSFAIPTTESSDSSASPATSEASSVSKPPLPFGLPSAPSAPSEPPVPSGPAFSFSFPSPLKPSAPSFPFGLPIGPSSSASSLPFSLPNAPAPSVPSAPVLPPGIPSGASMVRIQSGQNLAPSNFPINIPGQGGPLGAPQFPGPGAPRPLRAASSYSVVDVQGIRSGPNFNAPLPTAGSTVAKLINFGLPTARPNLPLAPPAPPAGVGQAKNAKGTGQHPANRAGAQDMDGMKHMDMQSSDHMMKGDVSSNENGMA